MLITMNVCDYCSTQLQLKSGSYGGLFVSMFVTSIEDKVPSSTWNSHSTKTFCCQNCFIEYVKREYNDK